MVAGVLYYPLVFTNQFHYRKSYQTGLVAIQLSFPVVKKIGKSLKIVYNYTHKND